MRFLKQKLVNQILLGSIAFGVGFGLGWFVHRNLKSASITGAIALTSGYTSAIAAQLHWSKYEKRNRNALRYQIQSLSEQRQQLYGAISSALATQQEIQASVQALNLERTRLLDRVSELHQQRNALHRELQESPEVSPEPETPHYYRPPARLQPSFKTEATINRAFFSKTVQLQEMESRLQQLNNELEKLQTLLLDRQEEREILQQQVFQLKEEKKQLERSVEDAQGKLKHLQQIQEQFALSLSALEQDKQKLETVLGENRDRLAALQNEIESQQQNKSQPKSSKNGRSSAKFPLNFPSEWLDFTKELNANEKAALKAILEKNEEQLKTIINQQAMMPEVLIEALNEKALNTLGDTLFESNGGVGIPKIHDEYAALITEPIAAQFATILTIQEVE
ncbi:MULTISPECIES: tellurite resistance TerB C-terminal domain-containing protein [Spirulina sp. CCY15215]|uniref:tellurite resistance TerB C-terminal domain-containing protein n=1 Tax=Spirulina sp. CCY15215 TaxID=2767591 RepID=UPI001952886F|nr:tellurite resistance TerB C-terminal domain-containing protein [Spirulina major]